MLSSKQARPGRPPLNVLLLLCWAVRQGLCDAASEAGSVSRTPFDYHGIAQNKQLHVDREMALRPYSLGNVKRKASFLRTAGMALASAGVVTSVLVAMLFPAIGSFDVSVKGPPLLEVLKSENPFVGIIQYHIEAAQAFVLLAFSTLYALLAVTISLPLALLSTAFFMLPTPLPVEFTTLLALLPLIGLASLWGRLWAGPGQAADAGASMGARPRAVSPEPQQSLEELLYSLQRAG